MLCNLIIDGNFLLSKLVFTLNKNNILYGALEQSLENSINNYRKLYPFSTTYLVSDSKEKSWRKKVVTSYKSTRKRDNEIDWKFVYDTYSQFKDSIRGVKTLSMPHVEGDDWISFLVEKSNQVARSTFIVSNDYDIKQILKLSLDPLWINIMSNEMYSKEKLFLPKGYKVFLNKLSKLPNDDIFNLNNNNEFLLFIEKLSNRYNVHEVDCVESLMIKLISGDKSDNIESVWVQRNKNGAKRGIGEKGAETIYKKYVEEFGEVDMSDPDLYENIADVICERKKISKTKIFPIVENIKENSKLIDLKTSNIPPDILREMEEIYEKL